jgi:DME family drug/metabolite transporter
LGTLIRTAPRDARYPLGVLMVLLGSLCFSSGGLILRGFSTSDGWQILFYRSLPYCLTVLAFVAARNQGRVIEPLRRVGWHGPLLGLAIAGSSAFYIFAVQRTTVANVLFTFSSAPLLAALLGRWLLGERVTATTWLAMAAAGAGVALMVADGIGSGGLTGNFLALGMACSFALIIIIVRRAQGLDMVPATVWGALVSAAVGLLLADSLLISSRDLWLCVLFGTLNMGAGIMLMTTGARHVPAAQVALLGLTEAVLAPIWVWLGVGEVPSGLTLLGGAIVLAAVACQASAALRRGRAPPAAAARPSPERTP